MSNPLKIPAPSKRGSAATPAPKEPVWCPGCVERAEAAIEESQSKARDSILPAITDAATFTAQKVVKPPEIIHGVLHQGCKLVLGGGSKTFKSWTLLDLALAVAHGKPWMDFRTARSRVCYVNLELPEWSLHARLRDVAGYHGLKIQPDWLTVWNLRGHATAYEKMLPDLTGQLQELSPGLIIIDPIYRLYGNADENSTKDMAGLMNGFEKLARDTKAAIAFAAHFAKGNAAGKESIDRISGSGVFARDPDAILTFTQHKEHGAFVVDATLRNCKPVKSFVVRWEYPVMRRDDELNPAELKSPKTGRKADYTVKMLLACFDGQRLKTGELEKKSGMSRAVFFRLRKEAEDSGQIKKDDDGRWFVSEVSKVSKDTSDTTEVSEVSLPFRGETTETKDQEQEEN